ncbi:CIC11C00000002496 [Sungouiella intermedia]|uniref:CIC11C00000002496 n=1 Tax=Sungouiella intermedia TaxID=45354 RepID=A0A1L0DKF1_9ASCO|nr:CIC11C00000002496 [[Candida] intermedia]
MKLLNLPLLFLFSLFTFTAALPVGVGMTAVNPQLDARDELATTPQYYEMDKRENVLLTQLFKTMNNTAGINLIKGATQVPLTQQQIIKFVANLIQEKGLSTILKVADDSGLAIDIVLLFLTHYEVYPGLTAVVKKYKGTSSSSSTLSGLTGSSNGSSSGTNTGSGSGSSSSSNSGSSGGGLLGNLLGGIGSIFGLGSSSSSSSSGTTSNVASSSPTSNSGGLSNLLNLFDSPNSAAALAASSTAGAGNAIADTAVADTAVADTAGAVAGTAATTPAAGAAATTTPAAGAGAAATTTPAGAGAAAATTTPAAGAGAAATTTTAAGAATTTATSGGGLSGLINGITGLFGINKRGELENLLSNVDLLQLLRESGFPVDEVLEKIQKRDEEFTDEEFEIVKRDLLDIFYQNIISLLGSNGTMLDICESLDKSGLGVNVAYNAIVDSGFYDFDVKLVKYLVTNNYISLLSLLSALLSSGVALSVVGQIVGNSTYTRYVINLVIAIFTGKVDILGLITALF